MSENLDLVRSICEPWGRGDFSSVDWAGPEIEFVWADGLSPGTWKGTDGMAEGFREWLSAWKDVRTEAEEYRELDHERVLVLVCSSGHGKSSGMDVTTKAANVFHLHGGKVTRLVVYADRDRALAELGLEELAVSDESTTPDLVELVLKAFEAAKRRDPDAMISPYAPDAVWDMSALGLGTFNGRAAVRDHFEDWLAPHEELDWEFEQVRDLGNGVVFGVAHEQARLRGGSGVIHRHLAFVWEFRDGLIVRGAPYSDIDRGRAAAERLAKERGG